MTLLRCLLVALAILPPASLDHAVAQDGLVPLKLFYNSARRDNLTTASPQVERDALAGGYGFARVEGLVYSSQKPGTVPLKLFFSKDRGDYFTTATGIGESHAKAANYVLVRIEGYVYPEQKAGTVPLKLFWSDDRQENFTTATAIGESHARGAKYGFTRVEGYVYPAPPASPALTPLPPNERATTTPPGSPPAATALKTPVIAAAPANPAQTSKGRRVALVIGNSAYEFVAKLSNPQRDAAVVATALRDVGFHSVTVHSDLTRERLMAALIAFSREADNAEWSVVYFAGHGIEVGGVNYLVPVDARLRSDRDVELEGVSLSQVLGAVERARKLRLVMLDACRDNPFASQMRRTLGTRSVGRGLASVEPEAGTLVVYAAKHGETALDGEGTNSPFASALVKNLRTPGVEVRRLFDYVRDEVLEATNRQQQPFSYGSLPGREDFYFTSR